MPNHVRNRLLIEAPQSEHAAILEKFCDKGAPCFERLIPIPGVYLGSTSSVHSSLFGEEHCFHTGCSNAWGTKWGPYSIEEPVSSKGTLLLQFETAWDAPHPVILELAKHLGHPMRHTWCCEGEMTYGWIEYDATGHTTRISSKSGTYADPIGEKAPDAVTAEAMYAELFPERQDDDD